MAVRDFLLPDLGEGLEEGEIVGWSVEVGETVELNQTLVQVETAKAVVDIPSPFAGKVVERFGDVGDTMEVGKPLIRIDVGGASAAEADAVSVPTDAAETQAVPGGAPSPTQAAVAASAAEAAAAAPAGPGEGKRQAMLVGYGAAEDGGGSRRRRGRNAKAPAAGTGTGAATAPPPPPAPASTHRQTRPLAKPPVRKLAKDLGIDLGSISGSGPDGVITRDDVQAAAGNGAASSAAAAPRTGAAEPVRGVPFYGEFAPGDTIPVRGIRARIAEKMAHSRREIPEATCSYWADCTELWATRKRLTAAAQADGDDVKVTPFAVVLRAVVLALRRFPTLNATLDQEASVIRLHDVVHLGFAADTPRGLIVPVIKDAHAMSTLQIAAELNRLAVAARDGGIKPNELTGSTFTVTNYGAFGNDDGDPVINHPEAGILGVGAMKERPWVVDGALAVRRTVKLTLAFDHRISDGGEAGRFVTYVGQLIEDPARILLHS